MKRRTAHDAESKELARYAAYQTRMIIRFALLALVLSAMLGCETKPKQQQSPALSKLPAGVE